MNNEKDEESLIKNINTINYYNEKIKENRSLCRRISLFSFFICFISLFLVIEIFKYLLITYFVWRVIMFFIRKDYMNKIIYNSGNDSIVKCKKCGYYKYSDKKCNSCGFDDPLKKEEKEKLLEFYDKRITLIFILGIIIVSSIIFADIMLVASIYGSGDNLFALNLLTLGHPSIVLVFLFATGLILCFFVVLGFNGMADDFRIKKTLLIGKNSKVLEQNKDN